VAHHAALQQRSYLSALRSLHRFFDYNAGVLAWMLISRVTFTPEGTIYVYPPNNFYIQVCGFEACSLGKSFH